MRQSIIYSIPDEEFRDLVLVSESMTKILKFFGLQNKGENAKTCKKRMLNLGVERPDFPSKDNFYKGRREVTKTEFIESLIVGSSIGRQSLKRRLIKFQIMPHCCQKCGIDAIWNGEKLSLQMDHINGVNDDNRIENLRFLCPNCHSQTSTFAGKSLKKKYECKICKKPYPGYSMKDECAKCSISRRGYKRVFARPSKEELIDDVSKMPIAQVAKKYKVKSDNTIRKWCRSYGIEWKPISPFSRQGRVKVVKKMGRKFPSKYLHVSRDNKRNQWVAIIEKLHTSRRFDEELDAAKFVAQALGSQELIIRKTNLPENAS